jgi:hypothetical protein
MHFICAYADYFTDQLGNKPIVKVYFGSDPLKAGVPVDYAFGLTGSNDDLRALKEAAFAHRDVKVVTPSESKKIDVDDTESSASYDFITTVHALAVGLFGENRVTYLLSHAQLIDYDFGLVHSSVKN